MALMHGGSSLLANPVVLKVPRPRLKRERRLPPNLEPLAVGRWEAADFLGVSVQTWDAWVKEGVMPQGLHVGTRILWDVSEFGDMPANKMTIDGVRKNKADVWQCRNQHRVPR